jgi:hypothetical protein
MSKSGLREKGGRLLISSAMRACNLKRMASSSFKEIREKVNFGCKNLRKFIPRKFLLGNPKWKISTKNPMRCSHPSEIFSKNPTKNPTRCGCSDRIFGRRISKQSVENEYSRNKVFSVFLTKK